LINFWLVNCKKQEVKIKNNSFQSISKSISNKTKQRTNNSKIPSKSEQATLKSIPNYPQGSNNFPPFSFNPKKKPVIEMGKNLYKQKFMGQDKTVHHFILKINRNKIPYHFNGNRKFFIQPPLIFNLNFFLWISNFPENLLYSHTIVFSEFPLNFPFKN
jgi:hypothetical protein